MGRRQVFQLSNTNPKQAIHLDFVPASISISNVSPFPVYVIIGGSNSPSSQAFDDIIPPFTYYTADPNGAVDFGIAVDNSASPGTVFAYPVTIVFSTGLGSSQAALTVTFGAAAGIAYLAKLQNTAPASLLDVWVLNDQVGSVIAADTINTARNGAYVGGPTLNSVLSPDGFTKVEVLNGTTQYMNLFTPALAAVFPGLNSQGSLAIWVQLTVPKWSDANTYEFVRFFIDANNYILISKSGASTINFAGHATAGVGFGSFQGITANNNWHCFVLTWNTGVSKAESYIDGVNSAGDLAIANTWAGAITGANAGADSTPASFFPGSLAYVAMWNTVLTPAQALSVSTPTG